MKPVAAAENAKQTLIIEIDIIFFSNFLEVTPESGDTFVSLSLGLLLSDWLWPLKLRHTDSGGTALASRLFITEL